MKTDKTVEFVAYSDIHYHHYTNGLTLNDVVHVEKQMLELAIKKNVDFIIFGGDRFVSRNPMYEAAYQSDKMLKEISKSGIPLFILIGNHDRLTKNDFKLHTMDHVSTFTKDLQNVTIMDKKQHYSFQTKKGGIVTIQAIPAGHSLDDISINKNSDFNICVFHALVTNSLFDNGTVVEDGVSASTFNDKGFDVILGGDNHKRQYLPGLHNSMYIGAPMQHNWGDEGSKRGFLFGILHNNSKHFYHDWTDSDSPKFMKVDWKIDALEQLKSAVELIPQDWHKNIIKLSISANSDILNDINIDQWKSILKSASGARSIDIRLKYDTSVINNIEQVPSTDADEWASFLKTKSSDLDKIDLAYLEKLGIKYINNV